MAKSQELERVKVAIDEVIQEKTHLVDTFELTFDKDHIEEYEHGWGVPIRSNKPDFDSFGLSSAYSEISHALQQKTNLFVVVLMAA